MIKFEKYYDGIQTHIQAISSEETKNNDNIDVCYTVGKYIKKEIEELQEEIDRLNNIINELEKWCKEDETCFELDFYMGRCVNYQNILDKIQELKEKISNGN